MNNNYKLLIGLGTLVFLQAGCTANPYTPEQKFAEVSEMRLVELAGSRIPRMIDLSDNQPASPSPVTIITRDDIEARNAGSVADALGFFSFDFSGGGGSR